MLMNSEIENTGLPKGERDLNPPSIMERGLEGEAVLVLLLFLLFPFISPAQKTPEELGEFVFKALKAENLKAVGTYLATPDDVLLYKKKLGYNLTKEQGDDFKELQLMADTAFIDLCGIILAEGRSKGIVWPKALFVKVKSDVETYILSSADESKTIDFGPVSVIFSHGADKFILTFETAFEASGRWRITGDNIKLRTYKE